MSFCVTDADTYACSSPHEVAKDAHDEAKEAALIGLTSGRKRRRKVKQSLRDWLDGRLSRKAARLAARGY